MIQLLMTNFLYKYEKKFIKYLLVQFPIDEGCMTLKNHEFWNNIIDNNPVEMFPQI